MPMTPLLGDRSLFPDLEPRAYLAHAAISPPSSAVVDAIEDTLKRMREGGVLAYPQFEVEREQLRRQLAALVGVDAADVALTANTTRGVSDVALSIPWKAGERVLVFEGEFPTNVTPWQSAARLYDLRVVLHPLGPFLDESGAGLQRVEDELRRGLRLVAVSAVQFRSGFQMPLRQLAELCARHGAELFVDAIQACGVVGLPLAGWGVHYAACGGHKWLMGPEGTGFVYVAPDQARALRPPVAGWLSHDDPAAFLFRGGGHLRYDRPLKTTARVFESGGLNLYGFSGLRASVTLIEQLGVARIQRHVAAYIDALEGGLVARGFRSLRAGRAEARSGILSVEAPDGIDVVELSRELKQRGVVPSTPDGALRFSPHWPNSLDEVGYVLGTVDEALAAFA